ncbi:MAG: chemotaxis protein CheA, partial [Candidatus Omnitrophota bacterium]
MSNEMIPDDIMEMLPEFLQESDEHLQVLNEKMLEAEKAIKGGASMSQEDLNTMFRSAHTIKGTASFIGLKKVVGLTHKAETLLQKLRDGELMLNAMIVDALFSAFDTLINLLKSLRENKTEGVEIDSDVQRIEGILNAGGAKIPAAVPAPEPVPPAVSAAIPPAVDAAESSGGDDEGVNEKYLEQFVSEADQNLEDLNHFFLAAEQDQQNTLLVNDIFRIMHTIKGSSGVVNAKPISEVAHKMENILQFFRSHGKPLPNDMIAVLFRGVDALKAMLDSLKRTRKIDFDIVPICKELDKNSIRIVLEMKVHAPRPAEQPKLQALHVDWADLTFAQKALVRAEAALGNDVFVVEGVISCKETLKSMRQTMICERLSRNGRVVAAFPSADVLDNVKTDAEVCVLFFSSVNENNIREILSMDAFVVKTVEKADADFIHTLIGDKVMGKDGVPETGELHEVRKEAAVAVKDDALQARAGVSGGLPAGAPIEISTVKIDARKLDKLMNLSGELVIIRSQYARLAGLFNNDLIRQKDIVRLAERSAILMGDLEKEMAASASSGAKNLGRVQKILGELRASMQVLTVNVNHEEIIDNIHALSETTSSLEKTASDLQTGVMQTRMIPVEGVFTRFKRIVRDISKDLNKEVVLKIEGAETELDRKIVDGLGDPLTHMIRNAVDHGLEEREERERLGKPSAGTILLRAAHKGNSMCIEISDDGRGMDPDKIAAHAVKKGIITAEQAAKMSDKEKLNMIFLPGFSTAQKITGLSGRGVGMDVVRSMIASFNGVVDIDTKVGVGSSFVLKIPLTLAIIDGLMVGGGDQRYIIPTLSVRESFRPRPEMISTVHGRG